MYLLNQQQKSINSFGSRKKNNMLINVLMCACMLLITMSCSDDSNVEDSEEQQDYNEVVLEAQMDRASEMMDDIVLDVYETQERSESNKSIANFNLPDCVTVTVVIEQGSREITIDFGTDGCEVRGHILKGKIILTYERNPELQQVFMTKSLVNFYFNALSIEGVKTFLKELSNNNGNPQFTKTLDVVVKWPNGAEASREGTKVREWIEGVQNGVFSDNVFEITGNWTASFVNGNTHSYEVITPLRREVICYYFVSGTVDVERTLFSGIFDYGDGDCDNQATFTFDNGEEVSVTLD